MKRVLFSICLLLGPVSLSAHPPAALNAYFRFAHRIYLAKVSAISGAQITFTITNVLRGDPAAKLTLLISGFPTTYNENAEFLLVSCKGESSTVGWTSSGYNGWIPGDVVRLQGKIYVKDSPFIAGDKDIKLEQLPDGSKGLSLDHIREFLNDHPNVEPF
jgi:hypothetical protein